MKKVSTASLIVGIVLVIASVVACAFGMCNIDGYRTCYTYGRMMYSQYVSSNMGLGLVIMGTGLFVGGILMLLMSVLTRPCKSSEPETEPEKIESTPESEN